MANDATNNRKENPTYQKFTDKILSLIDQITNEDWEQGWEKGKHIINTAPESIKERKYTGINTFALMLSQIANRYEVPVFMTSTKRKSWCSNITKFKGHTFDESQSLLLG